MANLLLVVAFASLLSMPLSASLPCRDGGSFCVDPPGLGAALGIASGSRGVTRVGPIYKS